MNETEKKKIFLMRVIIGSVVFVIAILWAFNLKNVWRDSQSENAASGNNEWTNLKSDLEKTLADAQDKLDKIKEEERAADKEAGDKFLSGLLEETARTASSSATSTSEIQAKPDKEASSTPKSGSSCPEYINCMPSIGETRSCTIPLGCEGITQIAY